MISVVLPVLNEPGLTQFLRQLHETLSKTFESYETIIVMGDQETLYPEIPSLPNQKTFTSYGDSLERAILLGFSVAQGDKIIVMDADGSHPIGKIPNMIEKLKYNDLVIGSRFLSESRFKQTPLRKIISKFFIWFARFFGSTLTDPMSGYFGVQTKKLKNIRFKPYKWKTGLELSQKINSSITEIPIDFQPRKEGSSKSSIKIGLRVLWDIATGR